MKPLLKILQSMLALAIAMFLTYLWINQKLAYFINQRFFILIILAAFLLTLTSAVVFANQVTGNQTGKSENQKWLAVPFFPILIILFGLPVFLSGIVYAFILIMGITRVSVYQESSKISFWQQHKGSLSGLLLMGIPLLICMLTPQKPLSTDTIDTRGMNYSLSYNTNTAAQQITLQENGSQDLDWMEILSNSNYTQFEGQQVHMSGFVYHENGPAPDHFLLGRYVVTCCVADAFAVVIDVDWPQSAGLANNQWVEITGVIDAVDTSGQNPIHVVATTVEKIDPLQQPYIYP